MHRKMRIKEKTKTVAIKIKKNIIGKRLQFEKTREFTSLNTGFSKSKNIGNTITQKNVTIKAYINMEYSQLGLQLQK